MLHIYGTPTSSPANKVRYVANYLKIPYQFHVINLAEGEQRRPAFQKINPCGKVPAIDDDGFKLAESNAIIRYLADKQQSAIYPRELKQRAIVDQWIDFSAQHIGTATSKIMYNLYYYKYTGVERDERSLQDGYHFMKLYLPMLEQQIMQSPYIAGLTLSLADFSLLAALDACELAQVDLNSCPHLCVWRTQLMQEAFYRDCHESLTAAFHERIKQLA